MTDKIFDNDYLEFQMPYVQPLAPELVVFNDAGASMEALGQSSGRPSTSIPTITIVRDETVFLNRS